jgi:hypothetical protein
VIALGAATSAQARDHCGRGFHRNHWGHCVPNRGHHTRVTFVVGRYYPGHGYWYDNRWYHHRYRYHHTWRYR